MELSKPVWAHVELTRHVVFADRHGFVVSEDASGRKDVFSERFYKYRSITFNDSLRL